MNKSSCEVSADVKEGKSGYDRKKSKLMLSGKATTMVSSSDISFSIFTGTINQKINRIKTVIHLKNIISRLYLSY